MFALSGCGGAGNSSASNNSNGIIISGIASKGVIANGVVKIFALSSDGTPHLLATTTTDSYGRYSVNIGTYSGAVLVEASGSYVDEATGQTRVIPADKPLRAALANVSGNVTIAVTPLTELAVVKALTPTLTADSISTANALISEIFKVDIVGETPVAPTASALQNGGTTASQRDYTLTLAALSQMMSSSGLSLADVITNLDTSITIDGMSAAAAQSFQASLAQFANNPNNATGITSVTQTNLANVGGVTATYLISSTSVQTSLSIKAIQMAIELPVGVNCRSDANGAVLSSSFYLSGVAPQTSLNTAKCSQANSNTPAKVEFAIVNTDGFALGQFATLILDIDPGVVKPAPAALNIKKFVSITDISGVTNSAISAHIASSP
jgi:hypothetical protein